MSRNVQLGQKMAENRAKSRRFAPACAAAAVALPLALSLTAGLTVTLAPEALAQSNSGIYINNDVLNTLGPGPAPTPGAPLAPQPGYTTPGFAPPSGPLQPIAPLAPQPQGGPGGLTFQTYGSGNFVVTRPGTLLFPPLEAPKSTLAPGFSDNHAARTRAMTDAFAQGPEPSSQLLIPLEPSDSASGAAGASESGIVVYMENLPSADDSAATADAPVLILRRPPLATPDPAPRKPEVPAELLAEAGVTTVDESAGLAPEFQSADAADEAPAPEMAEAAPPAEVEIATVETAAIEETPASESLADEATAPTKPISEPEAPAQQVATAPVNSADVPAPTMTPATPAKKTPEAAAPVSLLPESPAASSDDPAPDAETPATASATEPATEDAASPSMSPGVQTASLTVGAVEDVTLPFDGDSAELSEPVQAELRSLANSLRANDASRIQVLGFASSEGSSQDLARKLALSRALKVRTFLIDAGVPSARIQVRSLGDKAEGGPANRVDIRPIDS